MAGKNDSVPISVRNETAECRPEPTGVDAIRSRILTVRGVQVMLDRDLAELYGVEVGQLNRQGLPRVRHYWWTKSGGVAIGTFVTGGNVRRHEPFTDRQIGLWPQVGRTVRPFVPLDRLSL